MLAVQGMNQFFCFIIKNRLLLTYAPILKTSLPKTTLIPEELFALHFFQGKGIDAVPQSTWQWSILKNVPEVGTTGITQRFDAVHAKSPNFWGSQRRFILFWGKWRGCEVQGKMVLATQSARTGVKMIVLADWVAIE